VMVAEAEDRSAKVVEADKKMAEAEPWKMPEQMAEATAQLDEELKQVDQTAALQAVNLITASTKIISTYAAAPYIWIPMLALMWGTYFFSLSKANSATAGGGVSMGKGGTQDLVGGSHASGRNEIMLGSDNKGRSVKAEGGEKMSIFSRKASKKYGTRINDLVDRINSGKTSSNTIDQVLKMIDNGSFEAYVMGTNLEIDTDQAGFDSPELKSISDDVRRMRERGEDVETTDSKGRRVRYYRNLKQTYV